MSLSVTGYHVSPRHIEQMSNIEKWNFLCKIRSSKRGEGKKIETVQLHLVNDTLVPLGENGLAWLSPINGFESNQSL